MTTIKIGNDFKIGDKVFIGKKVETTETCVLCSGEKVIKLRIPNTQEFFTFSCPKCKGKGVTNCSNTKKYAPVEEAYTIKEIKIAVKSNDDISVRIKGATEKSRFVKLESEVFRTLEECQAWCDEKNQPRVTLPISEIVISDYFKTPSLDKVQNKMEEYKKTKKLGEIILDKNNTLVDGYISYKICQLLDITHVTAKVVGD